MARDEQLLITLREKYPPNTFRIERDIEFINNGVTRYNLYINDQFARHWFNLDKIKPELAKMTLDSLTNNPLILKHISIIAKINNL